MAILSSIDKAVSARAVHLNRTVWNVVWLPFPCSTNYITTDADPSMPLSYSMQEGTLMNLCPEPEGLPVAVIISIFCTFKLALAQASLHILGIWVTAVRRHILIWSWLGGEDLK